MKKTALILIIILPFLILGLVKLSQSQNQPASSPTASSLPPKEDKFKNLEIIQTSPNTPKYNLKSLNNDVIEIGTERHSPPKPYLKLTKWDNEATLRVNIPYETTDYPEKQGNKLVYQSDKKSIEFYSKTPEEVSTKDSKGEDRKFTINEEGGMEFDVVLTEKPTTNTLEFPLDTTNLDFFYQPPLNKEGLRPGSVTCIETECLDKKGNVVRFRPENVVGSYAVYYKDGKSGDFSQMGGKNYKAGKAFHIYRPKITDASGKTTWGILSVKDNILTVTIPDDFYSSTSYPLRVDPNFGYETKGASGSTGQFDGSSYIAPANGTVSSITVNMGKMLPSGTLNYNLGFYNDAGTTVGTNVAHGTADSIPTGPETYIWHTLNVSGSIVSGNKYYLIVQCNDCVVYEDLVNGSGIREAYAGTFTFDNWTDNPSVNYFNDYKKSIYATYSSGGGTTNYTNINGLNFSGFNIN